MGAVDLVHPGREPPQRRRAASSASAGPATRSARPSRGRIFPKYRGDLLDSAVVAARMHAGAIEETRIPRQPLDVLAQQIVACCANESWSVDDLLDAGAPRPPFAELSRDQLEGVLDMLAGRYPSDEFAELRPRIVWDRVEGTLRGRAGARSLAVKNAGTIPDRGLFGVYLADGRAAWASWTRRWSTRPGPGRLPARSLHLADRGDHPRPRDRLARARRARRGAVLEGRGPRPPRRAGRAVGGLARELTAADPAARGAPA